MVEILAPCGNIESLRSAVTGGANAVYLGLSNFNARMKADNFTNDNISEWTNYCHIHNVKVYVTLNTSIKQNELSQLDDIVIACENAGVDAFIITDLAILPIAKKLAPHIQLHASTQMGIHNLYGAKFIERLGFTRVVLSRECGLEEIKQIKQNTNLEIEYFVHGAICVAFSGGCLFSSVTTGNSGNRGGCLQPCRKEYTESLTGTKGYMLSAKDQCLTNDIHQLVSSGVYSLKIEGRMKSPEYVGLTCSKYAKILKGQKLTKVDTSELKRVYNRGGFSSGYAFSAKKDIMYKSLQGHMGEFVGSVISCTAFKGDSYKLKISSNHAFVNGDGLKIFRNGKEVGGLEVSIISSEKDEYLIYSKRTYMSGDTIHITNDKTLSSKILSQCTPKVPVNITASFCLVEGINITAIISGKTINYTDNTPLTTAKNSPMSAENVRSALSKLGDTDFVLNDINININGDIFMPKSVLNNARRALVELIYDELHKDSRSEILYKDIIEYNLLCKSISKNIIQSPSISVIDRLLDTNVDYIVDLSEYDKLSNKLSNIDGNIYIKLPKMAMSNDANMILDRLSSIPDNVGIYAENIYALEVAYLQDRIVLGGIGLNIFNNVHASRLGLTSYIPSVELSAREVADMTSINNKIAVYSYGRLPVMTLAHCPIINITGCNCNNCLYKPFKLKDMYGEYPIDRDKTVNCYFTMYNSVITNIISDNNYNNYSKLYDLTNIDNAIINKLLTFSTCKKHDNSVK